MAEPKDFNKPTVAPIKAKMDAYRIMVETFCIITLPLGLLYLAIVMPYFARKHRLDALKDHTKDNSHWRIL